MDRAAAAFGARCELARRRFFYYCRLKAPDFYTEERPYIVDLCDKMQEFIEGGADALICNMPPRTGKSRTAQLLVEWVLGKDPSRKIMTGSYNETLSTVFSKSVRNSIMEAKADRLRPVFTDVFPGVRIKDGDAAMNLWSLEGGYNNYLATSPNGTATGFGCDLLLIDDLIKNAREAYNDAEKEEQWRWFADTMLSRLEQGGKILIIMTRWATDDFAGRALAHFAEVGKKAVLVKYKAKNDDGTMLCEAIMGPEEYEFKRMTMGADVFMANYQQEPIDIQGRLYSGFKTYGAIPEQGGRPLFEAVRNYTDTADTGDDFLCSINYGVYNKEAYILDVVFTKAPMEETEPRVARMLMEGGVNIADIESNNGGRGFARNIKALLEAAGWNKTKVQWFHQSANKKARILSNATWVMEHVYLPVNWRERWPEFYEDLAQYQREGRNKHDDAEDALTGVAEKMEERGRMRINPLILRRAI